MCVPGTFIKSHTVTYNSKSRFGFNPGDRVQVVCNGKFNGLYGTVIDFEMVAIRVLLDEPPHGEMSYPRDIWPSELIHAA